MYDQEIGRMLGLRYLENFEAIWDLQTHLLSEADRWCLPIIRNDHIDQTVRACMKTVLDHVSREFRKTPKEVFSASPCSSTAMTRNKGLPVTPNPTK